MSDWDEIINDPRLDDEGTYDYLVEQLPEDSIEHVYYYAQCETCGKFHRYNTYHTKWFYCWDGADYLSYVECWRCAKWPLQRLAKVTIKTGLHSMHMAVLQAKAKISKIVGKIKKNIRKIKRRK